MPLLLQPLVYYRHSVSPLRCCDKLKHDRIRCQTFDHCEFGDEVALDVSVMVGFHLAHEDEGASRHIQCSVIVQQANLRGLDESAQLFFSHVLLNGFDAGVKMHTVEE